MQNVAAAWLYPIIILGGVMQAWGPPMNNALREAMQNPWLASVISFVPIVGFLLVLMMCRPMPLPSAETLSAMPWWAPLGGLAGAVAVVIGLLFVGQVGAGVYGGLTISANILMSLIVDKYGLFGMEVHALSPGRMAGAVLMVAGIALISKF